MKMPVVQFQEGVTKQCSEVYGYSTVVLFTLMKFDTVSYS